MVCDNTGAAREDNSRAGGERSGDYMQEKLQRTEDAGPIAQDYAFENANASKSNVN